MIYLAVVQSVALAGVSVAFMVLWSRREDAIRDERAELLERVQRPERPILPTRRSVRPPSDEDREAEERRRKLAKVGTVAHPSRIDRNSDSDGPGE